MNKRVTSIALFDHESLNKFEKITSRINEHLCKVPYRENDREKLDTLPYHFTFTVWNIEDKDKAMEIIKNFKIDEIKLKIIGKVLIIVGIYILKSKEIISYIKYKKIFTIWLK